MAPGLVKIPLLDLPLAALLLARLPPVKIHLLALPLAELLERNCPPVSRPVQRDN
jgi:hypothetical protein